MKIKVLVSYMILTVIALIFVTIDQAHGEQIGPEPTPSAEALGLIEVEGGTVSITDNGIIINCHSWDGWYLEETMWGSYAGAQWCVQKDYDVAQ
jgi:hypothetical protein